MYRTQENTRERKNTASKTSRNRDRWKNEIGYRKKRFWNIYGNPFWLGLLFYSDLSNTSFSKQSFIKNTNSITKKESENIGFSKHPYIGLLKIISWLYIKNDKKKNKSTWQINIHDV